MADFEQLMQDNLYLKKNLQIARHQIEKLQQELSQERLHSQEMMDKHTSINDSYNKLQKKHQMQMAEYNKDIATLNSQVGQLKEYIDHKQQQIQQFQLKMIPNLDQDMIRVKLINEMEGPYQQIVNKKDQEISRLKQKLSQKDRKCSLFELQLQTKEREFKRQISQTKRYYENENQKLLKDLNTALSKKEAKGYDLQLFKNQRKELQELRCTISLQQQNQAQLRKQLSNLKHDKEKLLIQISQLNEKKALQIHLSSENQEIRLLKQERQKLQDLADRRKDDLERMEKKMRSIEKEAKAGEEELRKVLSDSRQAWDKERQNYKEELSRQRAQLRKNDDRTQRITQDLEVALHKLKSIDREFIIKKQEYQKLKIHTTQLQMTIKHHQIQKKQKLTLSKDLKSKEQHEDSIQMQSIRKENDLKKSNIIINKNNKIEQQMQILQRTNLKLKQKLEKANEKIVELLKQKARNPIRDKGGQYNISRDRAFSSIDVQPARTKTDKTLLLQYRDVSFTPLVPPTIFTQYS